MKKNILSTILIVILTFTSYGQNQNKIDSLLNVLKTASEDTNKVKLLNQLSDEYCQKSKHDVAFKHATAALNLSLNINWTKGEAESNYYIGYSYACLGIFADALEYYLKSLRIIELHPELKVLSGDVYQDIGNLYKPLDHKKALKYLLIARTVYIEFNMQKGIAPIGDMYCGEKNYPMALKYYFEALSVDDFNRCIDLIRIGRVYMDQKKYIEADSFLTQAIKLSRERNEEGQTGIGLRVLARLYLTEINDHYPLKEDSKTHLKKALAFAQESESIFKRMLSSYDIIDTYQVLIDISLSLHDYKSATKYYELIIRAKGKIFNETSSRQLTALQTKYDTEKKEKQIIILSKDKEIQTAEIKRQTLIRNSTFGGVGIAGIFSFLLVRSFNRRRKTSFENKVSKVEMKALLSQMNPHFIFNSLNSIDDYILNNDIKNSSLYVNKFSRLMRLILESSRKEEVTVKEDMEAIELYIQLENLRMLHKVEYVIEVAPEINTGQMLIPPMLLQPFIENSFKHAFDGVENPKLEIKISFKDELLHCSVTDNGIGRDTQNVTTETKEIQSSLGTTITRERLDIFSKIKKSKAYFAFEDLMDSHQKASGTKVVLSVPASFTF